MSKLKIKILLFFLCVFISCNFERMEQNNSKVDQEIGYWIDTLTETIDSFVVEERKHYLNKDHFLTEKILSDQIVDLQVLNDSLYYDLYLSKRSFRQLGRDLFIYSCSSSNCHGGYPFIKDEIDVIKYSNADTLYSFVKTSNHGNWADTIYARIDLHDIKAISEYIKGPDRKPVK